MEVMCLLCIEAQGQSLYNETFEATTRLHFGSLIPTPVSHFLCLGLICSYYSRSEIDSLLYLIFILKSSCVHHPDFKQSLPTVISAKTTNYFSMSEVIRTIGTARS